MANYRQIHVSIWKDEWFLDLEPNEKLLFIYLFSNESASLSGIYKIAIKVIAFESGLPIDFVRSTLAKFEQQDKVYYRNGVVWVKNLRKYNKGSSKVDIRVQADIDAVPDGGVKRMYLSYYGDDETEDETPHNTDTVSIPYPYDIDTTSTEMKCNEDNNKDDGAKPAPKRRKTTKDARTTHPAIQAIFKITGRYPQKDQYDVLITTLGDFPDEDKLLDCWQEWRAERPDKKPFSPVNYGWVVDWYRHGIPKPGDKTNGYTAA